MRVISVGVLFDCRKHHQSSIGSLHRLIVCLWQGLRVRFVRVCVRVRAGACVRACVWCVCVTVTVTILFVRLGFPSLCVHVVFW